MMENFWNERYSVNEYVYGTEPNAFFSEELKKIKPGKILLPCDGEGRNAVYAASNGWDVNAFDLSEAGKAKAMQLAKVRNVKINYDIEDASRIEFPEHTFDAVAFIFSHFPADIRKQIHQKAITWLKPGGKIILEAFTPDQLNYTSGGPKDKNMLYTDKILSNDFAGLIIGLLEIGETDLSEGSYHQGKANTIRLVATKL